MTITRGDNIIERSIHKEKTQMETVAPRGKQKRFGDGESLKPVHRQSKITPELQAEQTVGRAGFPPLSGTHIVVCSNRW